MERGNKWASVFFLSAFLGLLVLNAESVKRTAYFLLTTIDGETIIGSETYISNDELIVTNTTVEPGGSLTLQANNKITLGPGFHAKSGSNLSATIAQNVQIDWNLPENRQNNRFFTDQFEVPRPALSIRGFDNTLNDTTKHQYSSTTFGVRQVLEKAYGIDQPQVGSVELVFGTFEDLWNENFRAFDSDNNRDINSRIFAARAFVALMSFIIEKNPSIFTSTVKAQFPNMPSTHSEAMSKLREALIVSDKSRYFRKNVSSSNPFKRTVPLMKVARAWDLYLALENAYEDMGGNMSLLLNQQDKQEWNSAIRNEMQTIWSQTQAENDAFADLFDVNNHEVQPGNWPLISFVSLGYVALGFNGPFTPLYDDQHSTDLQDLNEVLTMAMKSAAFHYTDSGDKRFNYWWYQTSGGDPFFAEGAYYLEIALSELLSFWHAVRANNMLGATSEGDGIDPFSYDPFLNVLKWHARIATPDGRTPPFDDGNKKTIRSSNLLSWNAAYGDITTGRLFAHIRDKTGGVGSAQDFRLIEIAIPRLEEGAGEVPPFVYGNHGPDDFQNQQNIVRFSDGAGREHYVFLNGEHGDAIIRGEGHEQPDQLQFLYYVGDRSYIMDSGYDKGSAKENSSWNGYSHHNTMQLMYSEREEYITGHVKYENYGGIEGPHVSASKARKISEHQDVIYNYIQRNDQYLALLKGKVLLNTELYEHVSFYKRDLIVVKGTNSYIIDINSANKSLGDNIQYRMRYILKEGVDFIGNDDQDWEQLQTNKLNLYRWWRPVEYKSYPFYCPNSVDYKMEVRELPSWENGYSSANEPIICKDIKSNNKAHFNTMAIIKIANSKPAYKPQRIFSYSSDGKTPHQAWYWQHDANTIDVIIKRSKVDMTWYNADINFDVIDGNLSITYLRLPAGKDYGFARFRKVDGKWEIDSNYQINLERNPLPLSVSISGPRFLASGQPGTWTANPVSAGDSPTYKWYRRETLNDSWSYTGVTTQSYNSYFFNTGSQSKEAGVKVALTAWGQTVSSIFNVSISSSDCNTTVVAISDVETNYAPPPCNSSSKAKRMRFKVIPESFELYSNYPNPFSPSTTIRYGIPEQADVTIRVYNIIGRRVATLVNETKSPGFYNIRFVADRLASGLYITRIIAEGVSGKRFVKELKMQLIK